jgi:hypothetical protein
MGKMAVKLNEFYTLESFCGNSTAERIPEIVFLGKVSSGSVASVD